MAPCSRSHLMLYVVTITQLPFVMQQPSTCAATLAVTLGVISCQHM